MMAASLTASLILCASAMAQFGFHFKDKRINVSSYPVDIQKGYRVFANKCSECHGLASSLNQSRSAEGWAKEVRRMQAMASSHINSNEADQIAKFLTYDETHRKAAAREAIGTGTDSSSGASGKQLFASYGCSSCHSVAGEGNTASPLDGIGSRRTAAELKQAIVSPPTSSSMPAMECSEKDLNNLVAYLSTLRTR